jgi:hypothetical protein
VLIDEAHMVYLGVNVYAESEAQIEERHRLHIYAYDDTASPAAERFLRVREVFHHWLEFGLREVHLILIMATGLYDPERVRSHKFVGMALRGSVKRTHFIYYCQARSDLIHECLAILIGGRETGKEAHR